MEDKEVKNEREELQPIDLLDVLFDPDNKDPIVLMDENGKQMTFPKAIFQWKCSFARDTMSNPFLPPEWDSIVCQRSEMKEDAWPKRLHVSP